MSPDMSMGCFIARRLPEIVSWCAKPYASAGSRASSAVRLLLFAAEENMAAPENVEMESNQGLVWFGIAAGAALGIGIMLSRRKKSRWESARDLTRRVADHSSELGDVTKNMVERVRNIFEESRKVCEDAGELWARGRKL